jgi:aspartate aminotransferase-like enzyme
MQNLRIPGPTTCPEDVLQQMSHTMINHRGPEFAATLYDTTAKLKQIFKTDNDVFILTASGTGGLEAAIVNSFSPGDKVLSVSIGVFGERIATIAKIYGAIVIPLQFEWGKAAETDKIKKALDDNPDVKAVLVTHNETSTGVTNDLESISKIVRQYDKLLIVDAVSSIGSIECPIDEWGIDILITGSQKGWMTPPGLAMAVVGPRGWKANAEAKMPRFYWDFAKAKGSFEKGQTPWTPALSIVFALQHALDKMLDEGMENIYIRHKRLGNKTREGIKALGLSLFADEKYASNTVTSIAAPEWLDVKKFLSIARNEHNTVFAGGQQTMGGKIFRIGHLGYAYDEDIDSALAVVKEVLPKARK